MLKEKLMNLVSDHKKLIKQKISTLLIYSLVASQLTVSTPVYAFAETGQSGNDIVQDTMDLISFKGQIINFDTEHDISNDVDLRLFANGKLTEYKPTLSKVSEDRMLTSDAYGSVEIINDLEDHQDLNGEEIPEQEQSYAVWEWMFDNLPATDENGDEYEYTVRDLKYDPSGEVKLANIASRSNAEVSETNDSTASASDAEENASESNTKKNSLNLIKYAKEVPSYLASDSDATKNKDALYWVSLDRTEVYGEGNVDCPAEYGARLVYVPYTDIKGSLQFEEGTDFNIEDIHFTVDTEENDDFAKPDLEVKVNKENQTWKISDVLAFNPLTCEQIAYYVTADTDQDIEISYQNTGIYADNEEGAYQGGTIVFGTPKPETLPVQARGILRFDDTDNVWGIRPELDSLEDDVYIYEETASGEEETSSVSIQFEENNGEISYTVDGMETGKIYRMLVKSFGYKTLCENEDISEEGIVLTPTNDDLEAGYTIPEITEQLKTRTIAGFITWKCNAPFAEIPNVSDFLILNYGDKNVSDLISMEMTEIGKTDSGTKMAITLTGVPSVLGFELVAKSMGGFTITPEVTKIYPENGLAGIARALTDMPVQRNAIDLTGTSTLATGKFTIKGNVDYIGDDDWKSITRPATFDFLNGLKLIAVIGEGEKLECQTQSTDENALFYIKWVHDGNGGGTYEINNVPKSVKLTSGSGETKNVSSYQIETNSIPFYTKYSIEIKDLPKDDGIEQQNIVLIQDETNRATASVAKEIPGVKGDTTEFTINYSVSVDQNANATNTKNGITCNISQNKPSEIEVPDGSYITSFDEANKTGYKKISIKLNGKELSLPVKIEKGNEYQFVVTNLCENIKPEITINWIDNHAAARPTPTIKLMCKVGDTTYVIDDDENYKLNSTITSNTSTYYYEGLPAARINDDGSIDVYEYEIVQEAADGYICKKNTAEDKSEYTYTNYLKTEFNATIQWNDSSDKNTYRPDVATASQIFHLYRYINNEYEEIASGITLKEGSNNTWTISNNELEAYDDNNVRYTYVLVEGKLDKDGNPKPQNISDKYSTKYYNGQGAYGNIIDRCFNGGIIYHTLNETTTFTATKKWKDGNDEDRPKATVTLWRYPIKDAKNPKPTSVEDAAKVIVKNGDKEILLSYQLKTSWTKSDADNDTEEIDFISNVAGLPKGYQLPKYDENGYEYFYFVTETLADDTYQKAYSGLDPSKSDVISFGAENEGIITNTRSEIGVLHVNKVWNAPSSRKDFEGAKVSIDLMYKSKGSEGEDEYNVVPAVEYNNYNGSQTIGGFYSGCSTGYTEYFIPLYNENGEKYDFVGIKETSISCNGTTIEPTYSFEKSYDGEFKLNGHHYVASSKRNDNSTSSYYDDLTQINYTLSNTISEKVDYTIVKHWGNGVTKTDLEFNLNGKSIDPDPKTAIESNSTVSMPLADDLKNSTAEATQTITIEGLEKYDEHGYLIQYKATEIKPEGKTWVTRYEYSEYQTDVYNMKEGKYYEIHVEKQWFDDGDVDNRPGSISFNVKKGNEVIKKATLSRADLWEKFIEVPEDPKTTVYTIEEIFADDQAVTDGIVTLGNDKSKVQFKVTYEKKDKSHFVITNKRTGIVNVKLIKNWQDGNKKDNERGSVDFIIKQDGHLFNGTPSNGTYIKDGIVTMSPPEASVTSTLTRLFRSVLRLKAREADNPNQWTYMVEGLPKYDEYGKPVSYSIEEDVTSLKNPDYRSVYNGSDFDGTTYKCTYTNTLSGKTDFNVYKAWNDRATGGENRPDLYLTLYRATSSDAYADGEIYQDYREQIWTPAENAITDKYNWKISIQDLPKYDENGFEYKYYMVERMNNDGEAGDIKYIGHYYSTKSNADFLDEHTGENGKKAYDGQYIVNSIYDVMQIDGEKTWLNTTGFDKTELPSPTLYLYRYLASEKPAGYNFDDRVIVENDMTPIDQITLDKNYDNGSKSKYVFPTESCSCAVKEGDNFMLPKFADNGERYIYVVDERIPSATDRVSVFTKVNKNNSLTNTFDVTNNVRSIKITKQFVRTDLKENEIPAYPDVTFQLYRYKKPADGKVLNYADKTNEKYLIAEKTITASEFQTKSGVVDCVFDKQLIYAPDGTQFYYFVREKKIENGYSTKYVASGSNAENTEGFDITAPAKIGEENVYNTGTAVNTYDKKGSISITGKKIWNDNHDVYKLRPGNIDIELHRYTTSACGVKDEIVKGSDDATWKKPEDGTGNDNDYWTYTFSRLEKYAPDGEAYTYYVVEKPVVNYNTAEQKTGTVKADSTKNIAISLSDITLSDITNTFSGEYIIRKNWIDGDNFYGFRPQTVTVELQYSKDGGNNWDTFPNPTTIKGATAIATLSNSEAIPNTKNSSWSYTFKNLPVEYKDGDSYKKYKYRVVETAIGNQEFTTKVDKAELGTYTRVYTDLAGEKSTTVENRMKTTKLVVTKTWDDEENLYQSRPEKIKLQLQRRTQTTDPWENAKDSSGNDIIVWMTSSDETSASKSTWTHTFDNLPVCTEDSMHLYYRVVEVHEKSNAVQKFINSFVALFSSDTKTDYHNPWSYSNSIDEDDKTWQYASDSNANSITLTNKIITDSKRQDIKVSKQWYHTKKTAGAVTFELKRRLKNDSNKDYSSFNPAITKTLETGDFNAAQTAEFTWKNVPKYDENQDEWEYIVVETPVDGYETTEKTEKTEKTVAGSEATPSELHKFYNIQQQNYTVTKTWANNKNDETSFAKTKEWTAKFELLYNVGGSEVWSNVKDKDHNNVNCTITVTAAEGSNSYTFKNLPMYTIEGKEITYKAVEKEINGQTANPSYTTAYRYGAENSADPQFGDTQESVTNTLVTIPVQLQKTWEDNNDVYGTRPELSKIAFAIYAQFGGDTSKKNLVSNENYTISWGADNKATISNLPKYSNSGKEVKYSVEETVPNGYSAAYNDTKIDDSVTLGITNKIKTVSITGEKQWDDLSDYYKYRPSAITLKVLANSEGTKDKQYQDTDITSTIGNNLSVATTSNISNKWTYSIKNLPSYDKNGNLIKYTVVEEQVSGYNKPVYSIGESNQNTVNYTNTNLGITSVNIKNTLPTVNIAGEKKWNDESDKYELRPTDGNAIEFTLQQKSGDTDTWTNVAIHPSISWSVKGDTWSYSFANLPKYDKDGSIITYRVIETKKALGYSASSDDTVGKTTDSAVDGTVTLKKVENTLDTIELSGTKTWDDFDNKYKLRPEKIVVENPDDAKQDKANSLVLKLFSREKGTENAWQQVVTKDGTAPTISLTKNNNQWNYIISGLPKYKKGTGNVELEYRTEEVVPAGYVKVSEDNGKDFTNKLIFGYIDISKVRAEENVPVLDQDSHYVPLSGVTFEIKKSGEKAVYATVTTNDAGKIATNSDASYGTEGKHLIAGTYTITEKTSKNGHAVDSNTYKFEIKNSQETVQVSNTDGKNIFINNTTRGTAAFSKVSNANTGAVIAANDGYFEVYTSKDCSAGSLVASMIYDNGKYVLSNEKRTSTGEADGTIAAKQKESAQSANYLWSKAIDGKNVYYLISGTYYVKEIRAPKGYAIDTQIRELTIGTDAQLSNNQGTFKISGSTDSAVSDYKWVNIPVSVKIQKTNMDSSKNLSNCSFEIKGTFLKVSDATAHEKTFTVSKTTTDPLDVSALMDGTEEYHFLLGNTYSIKETKAPAGYLLDSTEYQFKVKEDGTLEIISGGDLFSKDTGNQAILIVKNKPVEIKLMKCIRTRTTDTNGNPTSYGIGATLSNAVISISGTFADEAGNIGAEKTTIRDIQIKNDGKVAENVSARLIASTDAAKHVYTIYEQEAPTGYAFANPINFHIASDGSIVLEKDILDSKYNNDITCYSSKAKDGTLIILDDPGRFMIRKEDSANSEISMFGTKFTLTDITKNANPPYYSNIQDVNSKTMTVETNERGNITLAAWLLKGHTYELKETGTVDGYITRDDVLTTIIVDDKMNIKTNEKYASDVVNEGSVEAGTNHAKIKIYNHKTIFYVKKQDENGKYVSNAKLAIYKADALNAAPVETWTTSNEDHRVEGLSEDTLYVIKEIGRPEKYQTANDIYFKLSGSLSGTDLNYSNTGSKVIICNADGSEVSNPQNIREIKANDKTVVQISMVDDNILVPVTLKKVRRTANDSDAVLSGARFSIYTKDKDGNWGSELKAVTDERGMLTEENGNTIKLSEGSYKAVETYAPENTYCDGRTYEFTVTEDDYTTYKKATKSNAKNIANNTLEKNVENTKNVAVNQAFTAKISLTKKDATSGAGIEDTEFKLYEKNGDNWSEKGTVYTGTDGKLEITVDHKGVYKVVETKAASGYHMTNPVFERVLEITDDNYCSDTDKIISVGEIENTRKTGTLIISKQDETTKTTIDDVQFDLYKQNGTNVWEKIWYFLTGRSYTKVGSTPETTSGVTKIEGLEWGKYYIVETKQVAGYTLSSQKYYFVVDAETVENPIVLSKDEDGPFKATVSNASMSNAILNKKTEVKFVKKNEAGEMLEGGSYQILATNSDAVKFYMVADAENTVDKFTASNDDEDGVTLYGIPAGSYKLHEVTAPAGYELSADVAFTIKNDGSVEGVTDKTVIMTDKKIEVAIKKVSSEDTTKVLTGAEFKVSGTFAATTSNAIEHLTMDNFKTTLSGQLIAGQTYSLKETKAPVGYNLQPDAVEFEVETDGTITIKSGAAIASVKPDETAVPVIVFKDDEERISVTVKKSFNDPEIENAGIRPKSIWIQLYEQVEADTDQPDPIKVGEKVELKESKGWTYTWKNLRSSRDVKKDGKYAPQTISYSVEEVDKIAKELYKASQSNAIAENGDVEITLENIGRLTPTGYLKIKKTNYGGPVSDEFQVKVDMYLDTLSGTLSLGQFTGDYQLYEYDHQSKMYKDKKIAHTDENGYLKLKAEDYIIVELPHSVKCVVTEIPLKKNGVDAYDAKDNGIITTEAIESGATVEEKLKRMKFVNIENTLIMYTAIENVTENESDVQYNQRRTNMGGYVGILANKQVVDKKDEDRVDFNANRLAVTWMPYQYWRHDSSFTIKYLEYADAKITSGGSEKEDSKTLSDVRNVSKTGASIERKVFRMLGDSPDSSIANENLGRWNYITVRGYLDEYGKIKPTGSPCYKELEERYKDYEIKQYDDGRIILYLADEIEGMPFLNKVEVEFIPTIAVENTTVEDQGGRVAAKNGTYKPKNDGKTDSNGNPDPEGKCRYKETVVYGNADSGYHVDLDNLAVGNVDELRGSVEENTKAVKLVLDANNEFTAEIEYEVLNKDDSYNKYKFTVTGKVNILETDSRGNATKISIELDKVGFPCDIGIPFVKTSSSGGSGGSGGGSGVGGHAVPSVDTEKPTQPGPGVPETEPTAKEPIPTVPGSITPEKTTVVHTEQPLTPGTNVIVRDMNGNIVYQGSLDENGNIPIELSKGIYDMTLLDENGNPLSEIRFTIGDLDTPLLGLHIPGTGDTSLPYALLAMIMLGSLVGGTGIIMKKKRRSK